MKGKLALTLLFISLPSVALAQEQASPDRFVSAAEAGIQDSVPGGLLMLIAYLVAWLLIFAYLAYVFRSQRSVGEALRDARLRQEDLEERVRELEEADE